MKHKKTRDISYNFDKANTEQRYKNGQGNSFDPTQATNTLERLKPTKTKKPIMTQEIADMITTTLQQHFKNFGGSHINHLVFSLLNNQNFTEKTFSEGARSHLENISELLTENFNKDKVFQSKIFSSKYEDLSAKFTLKEKINRKYKQAKFNVSELRFNNTYRMIANHIENLSFASILVLVFGSKENGNTIQINGKIYKVYIPTPLFEASKGIDIILTDENGKTTIIDICVGETKNHSSNSLQLNLSEHKGVFYGFNKSFIEYMSNSNIKSPNLRSHEFRKWLKINLSKMLNK